MTKLKKQAGFTLVELIGIIILLGVIALITVPIVGDMIEESKKDTYLASMRELIKAGDMYYAEYGYTTKSCISADSKELDFRNKGEAISGKICFENGQAYLKDVIYNNYVFNGTATDLVMSELGDITIGAPVYTLNEVTLDGVDDYYDTGYSLFDEDKSFTIVVSVTSDAAAVNYLPKTVFHCMDEVSPYPGLVFDQMTSAGRISGFISANPLLYQAMQDNKNILVVKRDIETSAFNYYIFNSSGSVVANNQTIQTITNLDKNLIVGAFQSTDGTKGRFFQGTIHYFALYMEALDDETISEIMIDLK